MRGRARPRPDEGTQTTYLAQPAEREDESLYSAVSWRATTSGQRRLSMAAAVGGDEDGRYRQATVSRFL